MMDAVMRFLHKWIGGFFAWWKEKTGLPTVKYGDVSVSWSMVAFVVLVWIAMFVFLPGGLIF